MAGDSMKTFSSSSRRGDFEAFFYYFSWLFEFLVNWMMSLEKVKRESFVFEALLFSFVNPSQPEFRALFFCVFTSRAAGEKRKQQY
jgi:hypothetical protein